jgi:PAS domain S-box-containing protein
VGVAGSGGRFVIPQHVELHVNAAHGVGNPVVAVVFEASVLDVSGNRFRELRHAGDALIAVDAKGRILSLNPSAESLTGWLEDEAVGRPCHEVLRSSLCEEGCPFDRVFANEEQITSFDARVLARSGEEFVLVDGEAHVDERLDSFEGQADIRKFE